MLGVVWNARDESVPWIAEFGRIVHGGDGTTDLADDEEDFGELFGPVARRDFSHAHALDTTGLVELAASRSHTLTLPERERELLLGQGGRAWPGARRRDPPTGWSGCPM